MDRLPVLKLQEIPFDSPESCNMFRPLAEKPFLATPAAIAAYGADIIGRCLTLLQSRAAVHDGIDYLQVFKSPNGTIEDVWFIEDGPGGAITALLPSDY